MKSKHICCVAIIGFALLLAPTAFAQSLGTAQSFAVLGGSTVTNTGPSAITGNVGVSPGSAVTGFPPGSSAEAGRFTQRMRLQRRRSPISPPRTTQPRARRALST